MTAQLLPLNQDIFKLSLWQRPPDYVKVWFWLQGEALKNEGGVMTTYDEISQRTAWYSHNKKMKLEKQKINTILNFLEQNNFINTLENGDTLKVKFLKIFIL